MTTELAFCSTLHLFVTVLTHIKYCSFAIKMSWKLWKDLDVSNLEIIGEWLWWTITNQQQSGLNKDIRGNKRIIFLHILCNKLFFCCKRCMKVLYFEWFWSWSSCFHIQTGKTQFVTYWLISCCNGDYDIKQQWLHV